MQYRIRHLTRFTYTAPVRESVMELRMQPLEHARQRCLSFQATTSQRARIFAYRDHYGNAVHYFDIPARHARLDVSVESAVDVQPAPDLPRRLHAEDWQALDALEASGEYLDWLLPSQFARSTPSLDQFALAIGFGRTADPLTVLRSLTGTIYAQFSYEPSTTRVDSPIDDALRGRAGVCQDFAHIMIALARRSGIPARYVSGYIAPRQSTQDRAGDSMTHAWVECFLPGHGWTGFDPTNNTLASDRHIAVAIGRDYADVPPTRGVFKGGAGSELRVAVAVTPAASPILAGDLTPTVSWIVPPRVAAEADEATRQGQQ
jgi:transglutaminase-like putative cysteine protease